MNTHGRHTSAQHRMRRNLRRGVAEFEALLTLGVMFPLALALYGLGMRAMVSIHNMISALVGWPY